MKKVLEVNYKFRCGCLSEWVFQDEISLEEAFEKLCASFVRCISCRYSMLCFSVFQKLGPCAVCGELSAGFHFGAFTCEGCKVIDRQILLQTCSYMAAILYPSAMLMILCLPSIGGSLYVSTYNFLRTVMYG